LILSAFWQWSKCECVSMGMSSFFSPDIDRETALYNISAFLHGRYVNSFEVGPAGYGENPTRPPFGKGIPGGRDPLSYHSAEEGPRKGSSIVTIKHISHAIMLLPRRSMKQFFPHPPGY